MKKVLLMAMVLILTFILMQPVFATGTQIKIFIDVKPGSFPNSINLNNNGVIPVAVLTQGTYNVQRAVPETFRFGPGQAVPVKWAYEDVDGDLDMDLVFHFNTQETGIQSGDDVVVLTGYNQNGKFLKGKDSIVTVPK